MLCEDHPIILCSIQGLATNTLELIEIVGFFQIEGREVRIGPPHKICVSGRSLDTR